MDDWIVTTSIDDELFERTWQADDGEHAKAQHEEAFPEEKFVQARPALPCWDVIVRYQRRFRGVHSRKYIDVHAATRNDAKSIAEKREALHGPLLDHAKVTIVAHKKAHCLQLNA